MRGLLGEGAPLSKSSIRRLRAGWTAEFEEWSQRRLEGREVVYVCDLPPREWYHILC